MSDELKTFLQTTITTDNGYLCLLIGPPAHEEWYSWPDDFDKIVARIVSVQDTNVYFSPHLFAVKDSHKQHVLPTRTFVADLDNANITNLALNPTLLVETSNGRHQGYWIIDEYLSADEFEETSKKLSYTIPDCDHSGWPLGHRFRLPDTRNFKYDPPAHVRLLSSISTEQVYKLDELQDFVAQTLVTPVQSIDDNWIENPPTTFAQGPRETLEKYKDAIGLKVATYYEDRAADRSEALWALMMALFRVGAKRDEVFLIAKNSANNKFSGHRYAGERDLAKDVVRAERAAGDGESQDVKGMILLAEKTAGSPNDRKRFITKIVQKNLELNGEFVQTDDGRYWYVSKNQGRPVQLSKRSEQLEAFLDSLFDLNAQDGHQGYVVNHLVSLTINHGKRAKTGVLTSLNESKKQLLLHSGKADVYVITPDSISKIRDGQQGVLFPWRSNGEEPIVIGAPLNEAWSDWVFDGWFTNLMDLQPDQARTLIRIWFLFLLFRDASVTRPILALLGQPGSGKTALFHIIYRLIYGRFKDLSSVSNPEDFDSLTGYDPLVVFDNVDSWVPWLPDRLALAAAASDLTKRKLYTDNDIVTIKRQAIVGLTAHDPRFGRADVVDRMLILNFQRRPNDFIPERMLLERITNNRPAIWGSIAQDVQKVLAEPTPNLTEIPSFRISDFALLGTRIAKALGIYDSWMSAMESLTQSQTAFTLSEEDILVDVIRRWLNSRNGASPSFMAVGTLYETFSGLDDSFGKQYKSASVLSRRLWTTQANLQSMFDIEFQYNSARGVRLWKIAPK